MDGTNNQPVDIGALQEEHGEISENGDDRPLRLLSHEGEEVGIRRFSLGFLALFLVGYVYVLYDNWAYLPQGGDYRLLLAIVSFPIILLIVLAYWIAYRVYDDGFYALAAMGWLSNLLYVALECLFPKAREMSTFQRAVVLIAISSNIFWYVAAFFSSADPDSRRKARTWTALWLAWSILVVGWLLLNTRAGQQEKVLIIGAIPFNCFTLAYLGRGIEKRFDSMKYELWGDSHEHRQVASVRKLVTWPIYFYAGLQPLYLLTVWPRSNRVTPVFYSALLLKIFHGTGLAATLLLTSSARARKSLEERSRDLQTLLEEREALTASIEHEIRNPLGVMETLLYSTKERFQNNSEVIVGLNRIEEQRQRILDVSRLIPVLRGGEEFYRKSMEQTSIRSVLHRSITAVQAELNTSNILMKLVDDKTQGSRRGPTVFYTWANPRLLEQAFINLLKNGVEAIREQGQEQGRIMISVMSDPANDEMVRIKFIDNGCGVPAENLSKLTTLFTTKKDKKPNSGIGLYVTSRVLKLHGGTLEVESKVGEGTEVSLILPKWVGRKPQSLH